MYHIYCKHKIPLTLPQKHGFCQVYSCKYSVKYDDNDDDDDDNNNNNGDNKYVGDDVMDALQYPV